jgi:P27 family predicted phage terminase small subunit
LKKTKPTSLQKGQMSKEKLQKRQETEIRLKGNKSISKTAPPELCEIGQNLYLEIINTLPKGFLNNLDLDTVASCADSAAGMRKCREILNKEGVLVESPQGTKQNPAILALSKYSELFRKYADDIGLSPTSRAKLANLKSKQVEEEQDPLLKVLRGS